MAAHAGPSGAAFLADRDRRPNIDEFPGITLYRRDGRLHSAVHDSTGYPRKDIAEQVAIHRTFASEPPTFAIHFEPGVTMEDIEGTVAELSAQGVERYFVGLTYGKHVRY